MPRLWTRHNQPSHAMLVELLEYNQDTGEFKWRADRNSYGGKSKAGTVAGLIDKYGYRWIGVGGRACQAHILAWFYVNQRWPVGQIDHKNMVADDNRIANLREATMTQQRANQKVRRDSITGVKGVGITKYGTYYARIRKHGVLYPLGNYRTITDAAAAYERAAIKLFGEFARA